MGNICKIKIRVEMKIIIWGWRVNIGCKMVNDYVCFYKWRCRQN